MDFELTEEQRSLIALTKDFCKREVDRKRMSVLLDEKEADKATPWDIFEKADPIGLRTLGAPEEYGGGDADWLTLTIFGEALATYGGPIGITLINVSRSAKRIMTMSKELQDELMPKLMSDVKFYMCGATTEADAGTDIMMQRDDAKVVSFAHRDGDEWVINADKAWSTGAAIAKYITVSARTDREKPLRENLTSFLVPTDTPGFSVRENHLCYDELCGNGATRYENVRVPLRYHLKRDGQVIRASGSWLPRIGTYLGQTVEVFEKLKEYAKNRVQGGKPIIEHMNVGPRLAEIHLHIEAWRYLLYKSAWDFDQADKNGTDPTPIGVNHCHAFQKQVRLMVCNHIAEICGAIGASKEYIFDEYVRSVFGTVHAGFSQQLFHARSVPFI
ncbi:acyl-CoA dehydrogenase family protein [Thermodesulfobacteriota bacterium]